VRILLSSIDFAPNSKYAANGNQFFFRFNVEPRGVNAYINEISEQAENQPRPRKIRELKEVLRQGRYVLYDGFADSASLVPDADVTPWGALGGRKDVPCLQLEYRSYLFDGGVGGVPVGVGAAIVPLESGEAGVAVQSSISLTDGVFNATANVFVTKRIE